MVGGPLLFITESSIPGITRGLLGFLLLVPASELAVLAVNYFCDIVPATAGFGEDVLQERRHS